MYSKANWNVKWNGTELYNHHGLKETICPLWRNSRYQRLCHLPQEERCGKFSLHFTHQVAWDCAASPKFSWLCLPLEGCSEVPCQDCGLSPICSWKNLHSPFEQLLSDLEGVMQHIPMPLYMSSGMGLCHIINMLMNCKQIPDAAESHATLNVKWHRTAPHQGAVYHCSWSGLQ